MYYHYKNSKVFKYSQALTDTVKEHINYIKTCNIYSNTTFKDRFERKESVYTGIITFDLNEDEDIGRFCSSLENQKMIETSFTLLWTVQVVISQ